MTNNPSAWTVGHLQEALKGLDPNTPLIADWFENRGFLCVVGITQDRAYESGAVILELEVFES